MTEQKSWMEGRATYKIEEESVCKNCGSKYHKGDIFFVNGYGQSVCYECGRPLVLTRKR